MKISKSIGYKMRVCENFPYVGVVKKGDVDVELGYLQYIKMLQVIGYLSETKTPIPSVVVDEVTRLIREATTSSLIMAVGRIFNGFLKGTDVIEVIKIALTKLNPEAENVIPHTFFFDLLSQGGLIMSSLNFRSKLREVRSNFEYAKTWVSGDFMFFSEGLKVLSNPNVDSVNDFINLIPLTSITYSGVYLRSRRFLSNQKVDNDQKLKLQPLITKTINTLEVPVLVASDIFELELNAAFRCVDPLNLESLAALNVFSEFFDIKN